MGLRPAGGDPEAGDHLVEDEQRPGLSRLLAQTLQKTRCEGHGPEVGARGLEDERGDLSPGEGGSHRPHIVRRAHLHRIDGARELPRLGLGDVGRVYADLEALVPAVEVAGELDRARAPGEGPREAQGHVGGLGAGAGEADALGAGNQAADPLAPLDLGGVGGAVVGAAQGLVADGVPDVRRVMAEEEGAVAHPVVDVAVSVGVPFEDALGPFDVDREGPHPAAVVGDAVWEDVPGALEKSARGGQGFGVAVLEARGGGGFRHVALRCSVLGRVRLSPGA